MTVQRLTITATAAIVVLCLAACGTDSGEGSSGQLAGRVVGAGATSQEGVQGAWIAAFEGQNPDVKISYEMAGSGSGQVWFIDSKIAFAGGDLPIARARAEGAIERCEGEGGALIEVPVFVFPIAIIYNLPGVEQLKLSPEALAKIFDQRISRWDDEAIAVDNPGVALPRIPITPVNRGDVSGATKSFTEYMAKVAPTAWTYPAGDYWPVGGGEVALGDAGVIKVVANVEGAIGYADAFQAGEAEVARIEVGGGFAKPTQAGAAKLLAESPEDSEVRFGEHMFPFALDRKTEAPGAYPIVVASYLLACTRYPSAGEAEIVKRYLEFVVGPGGRELAAKAAGAAPLPPGLAKEIESAVAAIEIR